MVLLCSRFAGLFLDTLLGIFNSLAFIRLGWSQLTDRSRGLPKDFIVDAGQGNDIIFIDAYARFSRESRYGIIDETLFTNAERKDLIHPNAAGHALIADEVIKTLTREGLLSLRN